MEDEALEIVGEIGNASRPRARLLSILGALSPLADAGIQRAALPLCAANPFTYAVELIRFALYAEMNWQAAGIVAATLAVFLVAAVWGYTPSHGVGRRAPRAAE